MKTKALQLFKDVVKLPAELLGITEKAEEKRNGLAKAALKIKSVTTPADQELAVAAARDIRTYIKEVETAGKAFRAPFSDFAKKVSAVEQDHLAPLEVEQERLEKLVVSFQEAETRRVEKEEEERRAAIERAEKERLAAETKAAAVAGNGRKANQVRAEAETAAERSQAIITAPLPAASKASGVSLRKVLKWRVTDLNALVAARPDLCKIEPKASAINAVCVPEMPNKPPGLELWWENEANVRKW